MFTALRAEMLAALEVKQAAHVRIADDNHIAAVTAVAAIRAAFGQKLLSAEAYTAAASMPRCHENFRAINKHGLFTFIYTFAVHIDLNGTQKIQTLAEAH